MYELLWKELETNGDRISSENHTRHTLSTRNPSAEAKIVTAADAIQDYNVKAPKFTQKSNTEKKKKYTRRLRFFRKLRILKGIPPKANDPTPVVLERKNDRSTDFRVVKHPIRHNKFWRKQVISEKKGHLSLPIFEPDDTQTPSLTDEEKHDSYTIDEELDDRSSIDDTTKNSEEKNNNILDHFFANQTYITDLKRHEYCSDDSCAFRGINDFYEEYISDSDSFVDLGHYFNQLDSKTGQYSHHLSMITEAKAVKSNVSVVSSTHSSSRSVVLSLSTCCSSSNKHGKSFRMEDVIQFLISEDIDWVEDQSFTSNSDWTDEVDSSVKHVSICDQFPLVTDGSSCEKLSEAIKKSSSTNVVETARQVLDEMKQDHLDLETGIRKSR